MFYPYSLLWTLEGKILIYDKYINRKPGNRTRDFDVSNFALYLETISRVDGPNEVVSTVARFPKTTTSRRQLGVLLKKLYSVEMFYMLGRWTKYFYLYRRIFLLLLILIFIVIKRCGHVYKTCESYPGLWY